MPKVSKPKTVRELTALSKPGLYPVGVITGLYLMISKTGAKSYILRYTVPTTHQRTMIGLGSFSSISLADVRRRASEIRQKIEAGIDPQQERKEIAEQARQKAEVDAQAQAEAQRTVEYCLNAYVNMCVESGYWVHNVRGESVARSYIRRNIVPTIGHLPISTLTHQDVFEVVRYIWQTQIGAAPETLSIIRRMYSWAKAKGWCSGDNPADRRGPLGVLLQPLEKNKKKAENLAALDFHEIPKFLAVCLQRKDFSYLLLAFSIVTVLRGKMARLLKWSDVDLKNRTLTIPEESLKTKGRGAHTVYLSEAAVEILTQMPKVVDSEFVFPSYRHINKPMSDNAVSNCMHMLHKERLERDGVGWVDPVLTKKRGIPVIATQHGTARAGFKTWCSTGENRKRFDVDAVELCMAHNLKDDYDGAYNRATLEDERRVVMEAWGNYCLSIYHEIQRSLI